MKSNNFNIYLKNIKADRVCPNPINQPASIETTMYGTVESELNFCRITFFIIYLS